MNYLLWKKEKKVVRKWVKEEPLNLNGVRLPWVRKTYNSRPTKSSTPITTLSGKNETVSESLCNEKQ